MSHRGLSIRCQFRPQDCPWQAMLTICQPFLQGLLLLSPLARVEGGEVLGFGGLPSRLRLEGQKMRDLRDFGFEPWWCQFRLHIPLKTTHITYRWCSKDPPTQYIRWSTASLWGYVRNSHCLQSGSAHGSACAYQWCIMISSPMSAGTAHNNV